MELSRVASGFKKAGRIRELPQARRAMHRWARVAAAYAGALQFAYPQSIALRDGGKVRLESFQDLATFWMIFCSRAYPVNPADSRIIDAGANVGFFTLYAAITCPQARIVSIEPFPETYARLVETARENRIADRVLTIQAALRDTNGTTYIDSRPGVPSQFRSVCETGMEVQSVGLDSVLDRRGWDTVDLLKIDVEGSEYEALMGARPEVLHRVGRIAMEYHPRPDNTSFVPQRMFEYLSACGFHPVFRRSDPGGYGMALLCR